MGLFGKNRVRNPYIGGRLSFVAEHRLEKPTGPPDWPGGPVALAYRLVGLGRAQRLGGPKALNDSAYAQAFCSLCR
jgi:hypothetical protein